MTPARSSSSASGSPGTVPVPDDDQGATIEVSGTVAEKLGEDKVAVDIVARSGGTKVLTRSRAVVRLP